MKHMLTVYYDDDNGELERIVIAAAFKRESPLLRADVWSDLQAQVDRYLTAARDEMHVMFEAQRHQ